MGCTNRTPFFERMLDLEERIYKAAGIPSEVYDKFYVKIKMSDGTKQQIWTVVLDDKKVSSQNGPDIQQISPSQIEIKIEKPTLVMTHGFGASSCHFVTILPELMKHFRIVMFDNLSFGMNPKDG